MATALLWCRFAPPQPLHQRFVWLVSSAGASECLDSSERYPSLLKGSADEIAKEGMRPGRLGLEFRVELNSQEPGMVQQLDDLDDRAVGTRSGSDQSMLVEALAIIVIEFI